MVDGHAACHLIELVVGDNASAQRVADIVLVQCALQLSEHISSAEGMLPNPHFIDAPAEVLCRVPVAVKVCSQGEGTISSLVRAALSGEVGGLPAVQPQVT